MVSADIQKLEDHSKSCSNLSIDEKKALDALDPNHDIVIKPFDKGGNVVVMDSAQYTRMCTRLLNNSEWYHPTSNLTLAKFTKEFYLMVDEAFYLNFILKQSWEFICIDFSREATFYALPKLHKHPKNPLGRPIISRCGNLTENLSHVVANHLNHLCYVCHCMYVKLFTYFRSFKISISVTTHN